jgi:hypothetical protein
LPWAQGRKSEDRRQRFKILNIEQQNKEPQNEEVITSIRLRGIRYSAVYKVGRSDEKHLDYLSSDF